MAATAGPPAPRTRNRPSPGSANAGPAIGVAIRIREHHAPVDHRDSRPRGALGPSTCVARRWRRGADLRRDRGRGRPPPRLRGLRPRGRAHRPPHRLPRAETRAPATVAGSTPRAVGHHPGEEDRAAGEARIVELASIRSRSGTTRTPATTASPNVAVCIMPSGKGRRSRRISSERRRRQERARGENGRCSEIRGRRRSSTPRASSSRRRAQERSSGQPAAPAIRRAPRAIRRRRRRGRDRAPTKPAPEPTPTSSRPASAIAYASVASEGGCRRSQRRSR